MLHRTIGTIKGIGVGCREGGAGAINIVEVLELAVVVRHVVNGADIGIPPGSAI
jgi:hypothetical protein